MPPQIKHDLNRAGWETTDFPSVCESCLPDNPYVQMLKSDHSAECKICTRPFTLFTWKPDRTSRSKRTNICLTCARLKNCCQCCMLDLSFGLPIMVRDAALKMVAPGPQSEINREYYAQNNETEIEEGRGGLEAYEKTDEKARELLKRLANSEPYYKKQRRLEAEGVRQEPKRLEYGPGPIRTKDSRGSPAARGHRGGKGGSKRPVPGTVQPITPQDYLPPADPNITSLFVTGVEDDLPEHALRTFFTPFGTIRSLICSHRSHCAFINYATREGAEAAAAACQGKAIVQGCPLRVTWGKPKSLDSLDREERINYARQGRATVAAARGGKQRSIAGPASDYTEPKEEEGESTLALAAPPGSGGVKYASMAGE